MIICESRSIFLILGTVLPLYRESLQWSVWANDNQRNQWGTWKHRKRQWISGQPYRLTARTPQVPFSILRAFLCLCTIMSVSSESESEHFHHLENDTQRNSYAEHMTLLSTTFWIYTLGSVFLLYLRSGDTVVLLENTEWKITFSLVTIIILRPLTLKNNSISAEFTNVNMNVLPQCIQLLSAHLLLEKPAPGTPVLVCLLIISLQPGTVLCFFRYSSGLLCLCHINSA